MRVARLGTGSVGRGNDAAEEVGRGRKSFGGPALVGEPRESLRSHAVFRTDACNGPPSFSNPCDTSRRMSSSIDPNVELLCLLNPCTKLRSTSRLFFDSAGRFKSEFEAPPYEENELLALVAFVSCDEEEVELNEVLTDEKLVAAA